MQPLLTPLIRLADAAYRAGTPLLPDSWFDRLSRLAPDALPPIPTPLLSLDCPVEPEDWLDRHADHEMCVQLKADGVSVNLIYIDGVFASAHLRSGRDCTDAAIRAGALSDLPGLPPGRVEIRCEAMGRPVPTLPHTTAPTPLTRNAVAAALRRKGVSDKAALCLLAFDIEGIPTLPTRSAGLTWLACAGFATIPCELAPAHEIPDYFATFLLAQPTLPYPCDGLVISIDSRATQRRLGNDSRCPRWAISLKP